MNAAPRKAAPIEPPVTDEQNAERNARNLMRAQEAIVALGPRWVGWLPPKAEEPNVSQLKRKRNP